MGHDGNIIKRVDDDATLGCLLFVLAETKKFFYLSRGCPNGYMAVGYLLFLQAQIRGIIIIIHTHRLPEVPAGVLESGKPGDRPLELKIGAHNVRWASPAHSCVSLSCPATGRPRGTKPTTGGLPRGSL
jgi:hypothetical protein